MLLRRLVSVGTVLCAGSVAYACGGEDEGLESTTTAGAAGAATGGASTGGGGSGGSITTGGSGGSVPTGGAAGSPSTGGAGGVVEIGGAGGETTTGGEGGIPATAGASGAPEIGGASGAGASPATGGTGGSTGGTGGSTGGTGGTTGCPDSSDYVGDAAWQHELQVTGSAEYCGTFNETRTLEQEYAAKAKLTIAAGTYPLPESNGSYAFALPVCIERGPGVPGPAFGGAGQVTATSSTYGSTVTYADSLTQPLVAAGTWSFQGRVSFSGAVGSPPGPMVLDGSAPDAMGDQSFTLQLCEGAQCYQVDDITFAACNPTTYGLQRSTVTFQGGQIVLDLRIGTSMASTEPGAFVGASGTLDGTPFTQTEYYALVYSPTHHHFSRSFAVIFDTPIGGACGLKVLAVDPYNTTLPTVSTIQCDLSDIAARTVSASVTVR
jgi:hypothetical protein